jgi:hypothetical protein
MPLNSADYIVSSNLPNQSIQFARVYRPTDISVLNQPQIIDEDNIRLAAAMVTNLNELIDNWTLLSANASSILRLSVCVRRAKK